MEAMGDHSGPMAFSFLRALGAQPYGFFLFLTGESGEFKKGDFKHGYFKEGKELIEWCFLGKADVRRRGGHEKTLW
jgi:hypothetical protein